MVAVEIAVVVVVAVDEQLLDLPSVRRLVVREHRIPRLRDGLQLLGHAGVRHVADHHHRVDTLVAEPFEGVAEREVVPPGRHLLVRADLRDVDVAHHAKREVRLLSEKRPGRRLDETASRESTERDGATDEETT